MPKVAVKKNSLQLQLPLMQGFDQVRYGHLPEVKLVESLKKADDDYYNKGKSSLTDPEYDTLKQTLIDKNPKNEYLKTVGAATKGEKATLPLTMGSLSKERPDGAVEWWNSIPHETDMVVTPKFDGLSGLNHFKNGKLVTSFTRGTGLVGRIITDSARLVQGVLPFSAYAKEKGKKALGYKFHVVGNLYVKGEFVMFNSLFDKYYKGKGYKVARNFAVGMINTVKIDKETALALRRMNFIAYGIECPDDPKYAGGMSKLEQLDLLRQLGFIPADRPYRRHLDREDKISKLHNIIYDGSYTLDIAKMKAAQEAEKKLEKLHQVKAYHGKQLPVVVGKKDTISSDLFRNLFKHHQEHTDVTLDGIVVECNDPKVVEKLGGHKDLYPNWAKAVKLDPTEQETKTATIKVINWTHTKRQVLKPTLELTKALDFNGAAVTNVFLHNAKAVKDNKLGPKAVVKVIRSGDVIPRFMGVVKKASAAQLPTKCEFCKTKLEWTTSKTDLFCPSKRCPGIEAWRTLVFFTTLELDGVKKGVLEQLVAAGFNTVDKLLNIKPSQLKGKAGFQEKKIKLVCSTLNNSLQDVSLATIMHASNFFSNEENSLGTTRLQAFIDAYGKDTVLGSNGINITGKSIPGIGGTSIDLFASGIHDFRKFYKTIKSFVTFKVDKPKKGKLKGQVFVFTGFRSKDLEKIIDDNGGIVSGSLNKKTSVLFYSAQGTTKYKAATKLKVKTVPQANAETHIKGLLK